jgi:hypothetical protein
VRLGRTDAFRQEGGPAMAAGGFCPECRTPRLGTYRYCASCGFDYVTIGGAVSPGVEPARPGAITPALLAGISWIVSAALMGYLALLQLGYANIAGADLRSLAVFPRDVVDSVDG